MGVCSIFVLIIKLLILIILCLEHMFGILQHVVLWSIVDDSVITCDEIIESCEEETKTVPTNFNEEKATCKTQNLYILLT